MDDEGEFELAVGESCERRDGERWTRVSESEYRVRWPDGREAAVFRPASQTFSIWRWTRVR